MIGSRINSRVGSLMGSVIGSGADDEGSSSGISGVSRDATSGIYCPANSTEWGLIMTAAGLATGNPSSCWLLQESSGNAADSIGSITLTAALSPAYQQTITGWTRKAISMTDGNGNMRLVNNTTAADPSVTSTLLLAYVSFPAAPVAQRTIMCTSVNCETDFNTGGMLRMASTTGLGSISSANTTQAIIQQINLGNSSWFLINTVEKLTTTFVTPGAGSQIILGSAGSSAASAGYLYAAEFIGTAAQLSNAQIKVLLQTLGWSISW